MSPAGDVDHGSRDSAGSPDLDSCGPSFREIEATVATGTLDAVKLAFRSVDGAVTDTMLKAALDRDDEAVLKFVTGLAERGHLIRTMPVARTHRRNTSTPSPAKQALWNTVAAGGTLSLREMALAILES